MREKNNTATPDGSLACHGSSVSRYVWEFLSSPLRNALFALFIGGILAYGAWFAWYLLARFDLINLIVAVNIDDSFYYFQIARNLAEGKFSTFDGGITRTNGYHPIWLFLITPFYWVFDAETALFAIKAFEIMLVAGGVSLIAIAARLARLPWILLLAMLPPLYRTMPPDQSPVLILGLEAAASVFWLGLFFLSLVLFGRNPRRWAWLLAAIAFSLPWVRLEFAAVSVAATAALCLIKWLNDKTLPFAHVKTCIGAWAGILAYFTYNQLVFGNFVPVSGSVKSKVLSIYRWEKQGEDFDLIRNFAETFQIPAMQGGIILAAAVFGISLVTLLLTIHMRGGETYRRPKTSYFPFFMIGVFALAVGHLAKFIQSGLSMHPYWASSAWYYVPAYLMEALLVPLACFAAVYAVKAIDSARVAVAMSSIIVIVGAVFLIVRTDFQQPFQFVANRSEQSDIGRLASYRGVQLMDRLLPEGSVVGSWDSGIIGYFSRLPVVNLDGVANSHEYYRSLLTSGYKYLRIPTKRQAAVRKLIRQYRITHLANVMHKGRVPQHTLYDRGKQLKRRFVIWSVDPSSAASFDFWERMGPHFDHRSGDGGLIVDGRLAQAFFRDCAPDELVVWSWLSKKDKVPGINALTNPQTEPCMSALWLPRHALPPVRADKVSVGDYLAWLAGASQLVIRADWDVYLVENNLVYVKDPCSPENAEPRFFLHVVPADERDLPRGRQKYGFDNLDFWMEKYTKVGGRCTAVRRLPDYPITKVHTGQYTDEGRLWEGTIAVAESNERPLP